MDDLTTLLREAVEDVEPTDRRAELRERVAVSSRSRHLRYAITGGLLAAAVVVSGVAVAVQQSDDPETQPAGTKHAVDRSREQRPAYALYYVGETPAGTTTVPGVPDRSGAGDDPRRGDQHAALRARRPGLRVVLVSGSAARGDGRQRRHRGGRGLRPMTCGTSRRPGPPAGDLHASRPRPATRSSRSSSSTTATRWPRSVDCRRANLSTNAPQLDVLALASISNPTERRVVEGSFSADGRASSFEGNVPWELRDADGNVVREGTAQTYGWVDRLYPVGDRPDRRVRPRPRRLHLRRHD